MSVVTALSWSGHSTVSHTQKLQNEVMNSEGTALVQSRSVSKTPVWDLGFTGEGQIIGVSDSGLDLNK